MSHAAWKRYATAKVQIAATTIQSALTGSPRASARMATDTAPSADTAPQPRTRIILLGVFWFDEFDAGEARVAVLMGNRVGENMDGPYLGASADRGKPEVRGQRAEGRRRKA